MKLSNERKVWLREQLDEFSECHLTNFGDSRGWDVHGDLCDLLDDNIQLEAENDALGELLSSLVDVELERDKLKAKNDDLIAAVAGMRDKWTPPDEVAKLEAEIEALMELVVVGRIKGTWPDDDGDEPKDWERWSLQLYGHDAGDLLFGQDAWDHIQRGLLGQAHLDALLTKEDE